MKRYVLLMIALYTTNASAVALHYGDASVPFSDTKNTSPALAVNVQDIVYYGALFNDTPAAKTLRIEYKGTNYWLGEFCAPGTYAPSGTNTCIACGVGHYCTGGHHRTPCTYGAIGCPGVNNASDGALPDGAPINTLMTLDQVNQYMPVTNSDQWQELSCCYRPQHPNAKPSNPSELNNAQNACATDTIGPGTYLFTAHYESSGFSSLDSITGNPGSISNAVIAVFDHPVSYASIHGNSIFQHFIDTEHPTYTKWNFSTAPVDGYWYTVNTNDTNISDIINIKNSLTYDKYYLCVYELK